MKTVIGSVMWVGRATVFLVGLAVILALVFGVAASAIAGTGVGAPFNLGKVNSVNALSTLAGNTASSMLKVDNNGAGAALDLQVGPSATPPDQKTATPMKVDSQAKVFNLNADELDGKDSTEFAPASHNHDDRYYTETEGDARYLAGNGKAADADRLDGRDSTEFVQGRGAVYRGQQDLPPGSAFVQTILRMQNPDLLVGYICRSDPALGGRLALYNTGSEPVSAFSDNGGENPNIYRQLAANENFAQDTSPTGERVTFQAQGNSGTATIEVFSVHDTNGCHVQAQALVTR